MWVKKLSEKILATPDVTCRCFDDFLNSPYVVVVNMLNEDMSPAYSITQCSVCGCMEVDMPMFHYDYDEDYEDDYVDCPYCVDNDCNEDKVCHYCGRNL